MEGKITGKECPLDILARLCDGGKKRYMDALAQALHESDSQYDEIKKMSEYDGCYYLVVKEGDKWGVVDRMGKEIYKPMFEEIRYDADSDVIWVKEKNKWGVLDKEGKGISMEKFDEIREFCNNRYAAVRMGDKWGFINKKGEQICEVKYEEVGDFEFEIYAPVKLDGKWGIATKLTRNGKESDFFHFVDCIYDNLININDIYFACKQDGKWGISNGRYWVLPCEFDDITFSKGIDRGLKLKKGGEEYEIDGKNIQGSFKKYYGIEI